MRGTVAVAIVAMLFVLVAYKSGKVRVSLGTRSRPQFDASAAPFLRALPFAVYEDADVDIEDVQSGVRRGRRFWMFELELDVHGPFGELERELTAVVVEVGTTAVDAAGIDPVLSGDGVHAVEAVDGFLGVFFHEVPRRDWPDLLTTVDTIVASVVKTR
jgi:hypothetical protein